MKKKNAFAIDFYQKMGFVFENPNVTMSSLKQRYRTVMNSMSWETYLRDFVQEPMILKPDAVEQIWKPIIRKDPIFEETLSRL